MTTIFSPKILTLSEFLALPETKPANEFVGGSIELSGTDLLPTLSEIDLPITIDDIFGLLRNSFDLMGVML